MTRTHRLPLLDLSLVLMVLVWGANYSVMKRAFDEVPPLAFNAMRMVLASTVFLWSIRVARRRAGRTPTRLSAVFHTPDRLTRRDRWDLAWLGVVGSAFLVVVLPLQWIDQIPLEGALEWMGRLPGLGHWMKHGLLSRYLARGGFLALPNLRGGRRVVPEWVGRWTPAELAMRIADYYADRAALDRVRTELAVLRPSAGAARLIVTQALALA